MKLRIILLALTAIYALTVVAQPTRQDLAPIKVSKKGHFKYWKTDSPALLQLKTFVASVTNKHSKDYVPKEARLAVFDLDGTLLCETAPYYYHWMAMLQRLLDDKSYTPTKEQREFALQAYDYTYNHSAITKEFDEKLQEVQNSGFMGLTQEETENFVTSQLLPRPVDGLSNLTWGTAFYWPMLEVVSYLAANGFQIYLCSGCDRDLARPLINGILPIQRYQIISSEVYYVPENKAEEFDWKEPAIMEHCLFNETKGQRVVRGRFKEKCTAYNKVDFMVRELGQKPILAFGNSSSDFAMFEYVTSGNKRPSKAFCVLCDDTERELGNVEKASKCKTDCTANGWTTVSMRDDWTTIYGPDVVRTAQHR